MKRVIGILLLILSLYLGYVGTTKFSNSGESVDIIGIEITVEDNKMKSTAYLYLGFALISFLGGIGLVRTGKF